MDYIPRVGASFVDFVLAFEGTLKAIGEGNYDHTSAENR